MKKKTIVHLVHRLTVGGAERVLVNIVNGSSDQFRHIICSFFKPDAFINQLDTKGENVIHINKKEGNDFSIPFKIRAICKEYDADLIHSQGWATYVEGIFGGKILSRKPKFVFAFRGKTADDLGGIPTRRIYAQKLCSLLCDGIVTPSNEMRLDYAQTVGIPAERITVIPNGIDIHTFSPPVNSAEQKSIFGFNQDNIVFGCVARFDPVKNLPTLVEAFAQVHAAAPQTKLLLIGDGSQMAELKSTVKRNNLEEHVILPGRRTDVAACLRAMDVYVQPSLYEGLSNTILEAMATGLPVVACDVGGTKELVVTGRNGILVGSTSRESLRAALAEIILSKPKLHQMGASSRDLIEENFPVEKMVATYEAYFNKVITGL